MHKIILSLITALLSITAVNAANPQADALLRQAADKLRNAKSVSATCAINSDGHSTQARIIMAGRRFRIESPGYATWFDGRTQWTYSASTGEVTVTEPTAGELAESNPLSVIEAFTSAYNSSITSATGDTRRISMKARRSDAEISSAEVTLNARTTLPVSIDLTYASGQKVAVSIEAISTGGALPSSTFTFDKAHYPGATINDLR